MNIIKKGDPEKLMMVMRFECRRCGCIFEANKYEYKHEFSQREGIEWYSVKCPTCGGIVTRDVK